MSRDKIIIQKGDITDFEGEAIVNAANTELILGSGVAGAIREKGGFFIQSECTKTGPIGLGDAAITHGGDLKAKFIIHAAGMHLGGSVDKNSLKDCTLNSLKMADKFSIKTLAFPAIGTGVGRYPVDDCAQVMIDVVTDYLRAQPTKIEKIHFVLFDDKSFNTFQTYLNSI